MLNGGGFQAGIDSGRKKFPAFPELRGRSPFQRQSPWTRRTRSQCRAFPNLVRRHELRIETPNARLKTLETPRPWPPAAPVLPNSAFPSSVKPNGSSAATPARADGKNCATPDNPDARGRNRPPRRSAKSASRAGRHRAQRPRSGRRSSRRCPRRCQNACAVRRRSRQRFSRAPSARLRGVPANQRRTRRWLRCLRQPTSADRRQVDAVEAAACALPAGDARADAQPRSRTGTVRAPLARPPTADKKFRGANGCQKNVDLPL